MAPHRKPLQGLTHIVRFNWHFFALAAAAAILLSFACFFLQGTARNAAGLLLGLTLAATLIPLIVSAWVYDFSGLYQTAWLDSLEIPPHGNLVNIHSGFDETSTLLRRHFPGSSLTVLDFYNPVKHTEVSIHRARRAYPPYPGTLTVDSDSLPLPDGRADAVMLLLAAHENRDDDERVLFFREASRLLAPGGRIIVTEHLRNLPNLLAYNIGAFHFLPRSVWERTFASAGLRIVREIPHTPFITTFILQPDANT